MINVVGRKRELEQIHAFLQDNPQLAKLISLHGPGGTGKTIILRAVEEVYQYDPKFLTTEIIDLVEGRYSSIRYLRSAIAGQLDPKGTSFEKYFQKVNEYDENEDIIDAQQNNIDQEIARQFIECYKGAIKGKHAIIFLDTAEVIDLYPREWDNVIIPFLKDLPRTNFVIAGRDAHKWLPRFNRQFLAFTGLALPISGFSLDDSKAYFDQTPAGQDIDEQLRYKIFLLTGGKPILINLAIEWLKRDLPTDSLISVSIEELKHLVESAEQDSGDSLSTPLNGKLVDHKTLYSEFEKELVENILRLPQYQRLPILSMAYFQLGVEESLIRQIVSYFLTNLSNVDALFQELKGFSFIKTLPERRLLLHDEARRMINEYQLWERYDKLGEIRLDLFKILKSHFRYSSDLIEKTLLELQRKKTKSPIEVEYLTLRVSDLRAQQLQFTFEIDIELGLEELDSLFKHYKKLRLFLISEALLDIADKFTGRMDDKQKTLVQLAQITYYFDKHRYREAEDEIVALLENPAVPLPAQIEAYFQMGNVEVALGRGVEQGREQYETALQLCKENDLRTLQPKIFNQLGYLYSLQGDLGKATDYYKMAYSLASETNDEYEKISALIQWSYQNSRDAKYEEGRTRLKEVWDYIQRQDSPDRELTGRYYSVLGEIDRYDGKFSQAIYSYNEALNQFSDENEKAWPGLILSQRGIAYMNWFLELKRQGKTDLNLAAAARDDLAKAVDLCRDAKREILPMVLHRYGRYYQAMGNYEEASKAFREGVQVSKRQHDWQFLVENSVNLAEVLCSQWLQSQERALAEETERCFLEVENVKKLGFFYPHLYGKIQELWANTLLLEQFDKALMLYLDSIRNMFKQEIFTGRDRLDNRLKDIENDLVGKLPTEQQCIWWTKIYEVWTAVYKDALAQGRSIPSEIEEYLRSQYQACQ